MDKQERERYMNAIRTAGVSKAFDRLLNVSVVIIFIFSVGYAIYNDQQSKERSIKNSAERTEQFNIVQKNQEVTQSEIEKNRVFTACLKELPLTPPKSDIDACFKKIGETNPK